MIITISNISNVSIRIQRLLYWPNYHTEESNQCDADVVLKKSITETNTHNFCKIAVPVPQSWDNGNNIPLSFSVAYKPEYDNLKSFKAHDQKKRPWLSCKSGSTRVKQMFLKRQRRW